MSKRTRMPNQRGKIEAIWRASCATCEVAGYDFAQLSKSNPPHPDDDPIILDFPVNRIAAVIMRMRE